MTLSTALTAVVRVLSIALGVGIVMIGISTAGFLGILALFADSGTVILQIVAYIGIGLALMAVGAWLVYGGLLNFPVARTFYDLHVRPRIEKP